MHQQSVQPPQVQVQGHGHGFAYASYLHSSSWLLRKAVSMMSGTGALFDKVLEVPTPGLGEGHVRISVCLPRCCDDYEDGNATLMPFILVAEGGGFVLGQPNDGEHIDRELSKKLQAVVISADYAKSPRYPFPHALLQLYEILRWAMDPVVSEEALGVRLDPSRFATMGNSAGGNLTGSLSLLLSFSKGPCAHFREQLPSTFQQVAQILLYPGLRLNSQYSERFNEANEEVRAASLPVWAATLMEASYLPPSIDANQIFITPLEAESSLLRTLNVPPVLCITAGNDCLKYEARQYVANLQSAGCTVLHHECMDAIHGFSHYKKGYEKQREECWSLVTDFLQRSFDSPGDI